MDLGCVITALNKGDIESGNHDIIEDLEFGGDDEARVYFDNHYETWFGNEKDEIYIYAMFQVENDMGYIVALSNHDSLIKYLCDTGKEN